MSIEAKYIAIGVVFVLVCFAALYALAKESTRVYLAISDYRSRAKVANKEELSKLREELVVWAKANCWHSNYAYAAREALAFIDGRLSQIKS